MRDEVVVFWLRSLSVEDRLVIDYYLLEVLRKLEMPLLALLCRREHEGLASSPQELSCPSLSQPELLLPHQDWP